MWPNPHVGLVTSVEEIPNGKLPFCAVNYPLMICSNGLKKIK